MSCIAFTTLLVFFRFFKEHHLSDASGKFVAFTTLNLKINNSKIKNLTYGLQVGFSQTSSHLGLGHKGFEHFQ